MSHTLRVGLFVGLCALLLGSAPALGQTGATSVKDEGDNTCLVDGTKAPLPTLLLSNAILEDKRFILILAAQPPAGGYHGEEGTCELS